MTIRERQRETFFEHFPGYAVALEFCDAIEEKMRRDGELRRLREQARRHARGVQVGLFEEGGRPAGELPPPRRADRPAAL